MPGLVPVAGVRPCRDVVHGEPERLAAEISSLPSTRLLELSE